MRQSRRILEVEGYIYSGGLLWRLTHVPFLQTRSGALEYLIRGRSSTSFHVGNIERLEATSSMMTSTFESDLGLAWEVILVGGETGEEGYIVLSVFMCFGGVTSSSRTLGQETSFGCSVNIFRAFGSRDELFMADSHLLNRLLSSGLFILGKKWNYWAMGKWRLNLTSFIYRVMYNLIC